MLLKIKIEPEARLDIQEAITWYNKKKRGLGKEFYKEVNLNFKLIREKPHFEIRYDEVHCLPLKRFPYMIHYTYEKLRDLVTVRGVFHTSRNPKIWSIR